MAKKQDIKTMSADERKKRVEELKLELLKSGIPGQKTSMRTKEIKKALARIFTFNRAEKAKRLSK